MLKPNKKMSFFIQQNRSLIFTAGTLMGIIFYLNWTSFIQQRQEFSVERSLSETLQILHELESKALTQQNHNCAGSDSGVITIASEKPEPLHPPPKSKDEFTVAERGFWQGLGATKGHMFDRRLAKAIVAFFLEENVTTILELGAGTGAYAKELKSAGIFISCYDGNPETQELSEGRCGILDLSKPIEFSKHDWTLSLEVGEHIPKDFEDIFISNLVQGNYKGVILSWAVVGQGGTSHVNTRNNNHIRNKMVSNGYISDFEAEKILRVASTFRWFKNTIMVFRKQI